MTENKCICKRLEEGRINLRCPMHVGQFKIDKKHLAKPEDSGTIELDKIW